MSYQSYNIVDVGLCQMLQCKLTLSPTFILYTLERKVATHKRMKGYFPLPWGWSRENLSYLEVFCMGDLFFSPSYLFNHVFISMYTHIFILYFELQSKNLFCCPNCSSFSHWECFHLVPVSLQLILFLYCSCIL